MDDSEINKLKNIPPFYDNVLLLGGYKLEPEQLISASYEERMRVTISGLTARKTLAIREQIGNI